MGKSCGNIQCLVNAQVSVNRAVFAANDSSDGNKLKMSDDHRRDYLLQCAKDAIEELRQYVRSYPKPRKANK